MSTPQANTPLRLTSRFTQAVDYAREIHGGTRKGTQVPYMAHLLGVASLVMGESGHVPFAVTEDTIIAALLHDAVEDEGGLPRLEDIQAKFGKEVANIVKGCTDSFEVDSDKKQNWEARKASYIKRLHDEGEESEGTLLVSVADKLYNARAILEDYREVGAEVWMRFKRGRDQQLWYFAELIKEYEQRCSNWRIIEELKRVVTELARISESGYGKMTNTAIGKPDEQKKRSARNLKTWGSAVLLLSFITQNFIYERWNARATLLEKGMVERSILDKSVLLNEVLYFTAKSSSETPTDDLKKSYIHEAARKLAYSSVFPTASDATLTTREKTELSNSLLSQARAVDDFPAFLALAKTANDSFGKYAEDMNRQSDQISSKRAFARNIYLAVYILGAFLLLYAVRKE